MEVIPTIFAIALVVLTIVLSVVGVQMVLVLMEVKRTIQKVNDTVEHAEAKFDAVIAPLQRIGSAAAGIGTGVKVLEAFVGWLNRDSGSKSKK